VLAYGVHESGYQEVIALDVGEAETFWRSFLRSLVERGLGATRQRGVSWFRCAI
jgi:transposase-like protein